MAGCLITPTLGLIVALSGVFGACSDPDDSHTDTNSDATVADSDATGADSDATGADSDATGADSDAVDDTQSPPDTTLATDTTPEDVAPEEVAPDVRTDTDVEADADAAPLDGEFVAAYLAGWGVGNPTNVFESQFLKATPQRVELLSNGDLVVSGVEDTPSPNPGVTAFESRLYRFAGRDGELVWKDDHWAAPHVFRSLVAVGPDDTVLTHTWDRNAFSAERFGLRMLSAGGETLWETPTDFEQAVYEIIDPARDREALPTGGIQPDGITVVAQSFVGGGARATCFAVFDTAGARQGGDCVLGVEASVGPVATARGELSWLGFDGRADVIGGFQVSSELSILTVDAALGEARVVTLDASPFETPPPSEIEVTRAFWFPVAVTREPGGALRIVAVEQYGAYDNYHVLRVADAGQVQAHALLYAPRASDGFLPRIAAMAETPGGALVVGAREVNPITRYAAIIDAELASEAVLGATGAFALPELDGFAVAWRGVASRGGKTVLVGSLEDSAILIFSTHRL